jgi:hypothetical protein
VIYLSESGLVVSRFGINVSDSDPLEEMARSGATAACIPSSDRVLHSQLRKHETHLLGSSQAVKFVCNSKRTTVQTSADIGLM